jgi:glycosyltransferase involved in cell wall biosynthesis
VRKKNVCMNQREKLLFIGTYVPCYDQASGDLRLFSILKILSTYYDIVYLASNAYPDPREQDKYRSSLQELGIKVSVGEFSLVNLFRNNKFAAAIIEFYYNAKNVLQKIKMLQPACPVIIDTVDVHYVRLYLQYQITRDLNDLRKAETTKKEELDIYKKADIVITVTDEDAAMLLKDSKGLCLRTVSNIHHLVPSNSAQDRNGIVFVGGFSHDPNVDAVLYFCKDILPLIRKTVPNITFTIVGSKPPEKVKALNSNSIIVTGYVPSTTPYLHANYISVAPLRYGAGMKGKIGEAMAHGLPVVTTSIGSEGMGLLSRKNAMIADSPESFAVAVVELIKDEQLYRTIAGNASEHVKNNYTDVQVGRQIRNILAEARNLKVKKITLSEKAGLVWKYALNKTRKKFGIQSIKE